MKLNRYEKTLVTIIEAGYFIGSLLFFFSGVLVAFRTMGG